MISVSHVLVFADLPYCSSFTAIVSVLPKDMPSRSSPVARLRAKSALIGLLNVLTDEFHTNPDITEEDDIVNVPRFSHHAVICRHLLIDTFYG